MPNPPEIDRPFAGSDERAAAHAEFVRLGEIVRQVLSAADAAVFPAWLTGELEKPTRGVERPAVDRLNRYRVIFAEELATLTDAVNRERQRPLDDFSLHAGLYLAERLLASLLGCPIGELQEHLPSG